MSNNDPLAWMRYEQDLARAKISRAMLDSPSVINQMTKREGSNYLNVGWELSDGSHHRSDANGLASAVFINRDDRIAVIAFNSDFSKSGLALLADGEILKELGVPARTGSTTREVAELQQFILAKSGILKDQWHPQFSEALDYAKENQARLEAAGYKVEVTGHGPGGSVAQLVSYTLDIPGSAYDPLGAKNLVGSDGYATWCRQNGIDPAARDAGVAELKSMGLNASGTDFTNYKVNASKASELSGEHLGNTRSISALTGRQGFQEHLNYAGSLAGGVLDTWSTGIGDALPLFKGASNVTALESLGEAADIGGKSGKIMGWADTAGRHDIDRIVRLFETAVKENKLPTWGEQAPTLPRVADPQLALDPRSQQHPMHPLWKSSLEAVERLDHSLGRSSDATSHCLAGSVTLMAAKCGMTHVDHVALSKASADTPSGATVFVVQGAMDDPAHLRTHMPTLQASEMPLQQSLAQAVTANEQRIEQSLQEQAREQQHAHAARSQGS